MNIIPSIAAIVTGLLFLPAFVSAQQVVRSPELLMNHQLHVDALKNAQEAQYLETLKKYQVYCERYPSDVAVRMEQCRFIEKAFYNEEEEYNPKYSEFESCLNKLYRDFPEHPDVLFYKSENYYGDSSIIFLESLVPRLEREPSLWKDQAWKVYRNLAQQYYYEEKYLQTTQAAENACKLNDTLDLSILLAKSYIAISRKDEAKKELVSKLQRHCTSYEAGQKADLLLQLGEADMALKTYMKAQEDTSYTPDYVGISTSFEKLGKYQEGHSCLVKDACQATWNKEEKLERLFLYDLRTQPDSAFQSYQQLRALGFHTDPLGRHRIALFFKDPAGAWKLRDITGLLSLALLLLLLVVLPSVLVLPVHFTGLKYPMKGRVNRDEVFHWGLKSFWFVISAYLLNSLLCTMVFSYSEVTDLFNTAYQREDGDADNEVLAKTHLMFTSLFMITALLVLRKKGFQSIWGDGWGIKKIIGYGIISFLGVKFIFSLGKFFLRYCFPEGIDALFSLSSSIQETHPDDISRIILAIYHSYSPLLALLVAVIMAPIYEEIIFRGVILSACEKHLNFVWANIIQSCLFAVIHFNLSFFLFYFLFGMVAGLLRNRSSGLASGMVFHSVNNLAAYLFLIRMHGS